MGVLLKGNAHELASQVRTATLTRHRSTTESTITTKNEKLESKVNSTINIDNSLTNDKMAMNDMSIDSSEIPLSDMEIGGDILGLKANNNGRSCSEHYCCGDQVKMLVISRYSGRPPSSTS